jgi:uncharacterized protein
MQDLLEYIVKNLVSKPDAVKVEQTNDNGVVNLELTVDPEDMGLIIGKGGQTIHALRKLLTVRAISENVRVNLHLNEPAGGESKVENLESSEELTPESEKTPLEELPQESKDS